MIYKIWFLLLLSIITSHSSEKSEKELSIVSWNLQASYFDELSPKHAWSTRKHAVEATIDFLKPDIIAVQEISPQQALDLGKNDNYRSLFLPLENEPISKLYSPDNISSFLSRNDLLLNGIFYRSSTWQYLNSGSFSLYHETRDIEDIFSSNCGYNRFKNMIQTRGALYVKLQNVTNKTIVHIFNSHYPINNTKNLTKMCAEKERRMMDVILKNEEKPYWISCGDRNHFKDGKRMHTDDTQLLPLDGHDAWDPKTQGLTTTFAGFSGSLFDNPIENGRFIYDLRTSVIISNKTALTCEHTLPSYKIKPWKFIINPEYFDNDRFFASDHALVNAHYPL